MISRASEAAGLRLARELGLDSTFIYEDEKRGWKLSRFIPQAQSLDTNNDAQLKRTMEMCRLLHDSERDKVTRLKAHATADGYPTCVCHNDFFPLNFLVEANGQMSLIDWEYAGMSDVANDFGTFVVCSELSEQRADQALDYYFGRPATFEERRHFWSYVVFAG